MKIPFHDVVSRDVRVRGSMLASPTDSEEMVKWIDKHEIKVLTKSFKGLKSIGELVEAVEMGQVRGKAAIVADKSQVEKDEMRCFLWESSRDHDRVSLRECVEELVRGHVRREFGRVSAGGTKGGDVEGYGIWLLESWLHAAYSYQSTSYSWCGGHLDGQGSYCAFTHSCWAIHCTTSSEGGPSLSLTVRC